LIKKYIAFLGDSNAGAHTWIRRLHNLDPIEINNVEDNNHSNSADDSKKHTSEPGSDFIDDIFFRLEPKSDIVIITITKEIYNNRLLGKSYLKQCKSIFLFYDINNRDSFKCLDAYVEIIQDLNPPPNIILVGTYADKVKVDDKKITGDEVNNKANEIATKIFPNNFDKEIKTITVNTTTPKTYSINKFKKMVRQQLNESDEINKIKSITPQPEQKLSINTEKSNSINNSSSNQNEKKFNQSMVTLDKQDTKKNTSKKNKYWPIIVTISGGAIVGGCGGYFSGRALAYQDHSKRIVAFCTIIGAIIIGGFAGVIRYIIKNSSYQNDNEKLNEKETSSTPSYRY